jgi:hypothetical protein
MGKVWFIKTIDYQHQKEMGNQDQKKAWEKFKCTPPSIRSQSKKASCCFSQIIPHSEVK